MKLILIIFCTIVFISEANSQNRNVVPKSTVGAYSLKTKLPENPIQYIYADQPISKKRDTLSFRQSDENQSNISFKQNTPVVLTETQKMILAGYEKRLASKGRFENNTIPSTKSLVPITLKFTRDVVEDAGDKKE